MCLMHLARKGQNDDFFAIGVLFLLAFAFTLVQYVEVFLLKRKEEQNTKKPKEEPIFNVMSGLELICPADMLTHFEMHKR